MSVVFHFMLVVILVYVDRTRMKSKVRVFLDRIRMKYNVLFILVVLGDDAFSKEVLYSSRQLILVVNSCIFCSCIGSNKKLN